MLKDCYKFQLHSIAERLWKSFLEKNIPTTHTVTVCRQCVCAACTRCRGCSPTPLWALRLSQPPGSGSAAGLPATTRESRRLIPVWQVAAPWESVSSGVKGLSSDGTELNSALFKLRRGKLGIQNLKLYILDGAPLCQSRCPRRW